MKRLLLAVVTILVIYGLYYFISPIFIVREVNDAAPVTTTVPVADDQVSENLEVIEPISFPITDTASYPASGSVRLLDTTEGKVIRFEDFETANGPDVHLYLSKDLEANDFIDLGPIKGTVGNINYQVPDGVDLSEYRYAMHWCVTFSELFNYVEIK